MAYIVNEFNGYESRTYKSFADAEAHYDEFVAHLASIGVNADTDYIFIIEE